MSDIPRRAHDLTCLRCGSPFTALRSDAKYCSGNCQKKASYHRGRGAELAAARIKNCQHCGNEFAPKRSDAKYCSAKCSSRAYYEENRDRVLAFNRQWALDHPQETKAIQQRSNEKHGARHRAAKRRRYAEVSADPDRAEERHRKRLEYYDAHRERALEIERQRRVQDPFYGLYYRHGGIDWRVLFKSLWEAQDGKCYLCGDPLQPDAYRAIHLDHDHSCCKLGRSCAICRRGLACKPCNVLIGHAHDDPVRLHRIADNLEKANAAVAQRMAEAGGQLFA
jgi:predicted nucleic acid-binding Zn ribbon protein